MAIPITKMITIGLLPNFLKILYYKSKGAKIGKNVRFGLLSYIDAKKIEIQDDVKIGHISFINAREVFIGKRSKINMQVAIDTVYFFLDSDSVIMEQTIIGGMITPRSSIKIGKRVKIFPFSFLNPTEPIILEDDVGIGGANYLFTHGSWQNVLDGYPIAFGPITIKKGVWFPWRVFVMPNVTVGEYSTIGAGSIITKDIPDRSLAVGTPAKVISSDGQYLKNFTYDEKFNIVKDIIKQLSEYLTFLEHENDYEDNGDTIVINLKAENLKILLVKNFNSIKIETNSILISFEEINSDIIKSLKDKDIMYFGILSHQSEYFDNKYWKIVSEFFSRWGIRFHLD